MLRRDAMGCDGMRVIFTIRNLLSTARSLVCVSKVQYRYVDGTVERAA